MSVRIKDVSNFRGGADGYYHHVIDDLGAKIYRKAEYGLAQKEYLITLYAQTSGLTVEALAWGTFSIPQGKHKYVSRPGIWMRHIAGQNCRDYARELGWEHNSNFSKINAESWGYEAPQFSPILDQIETIGTVLKEMGISCNDHETNFGNFMIPEGSQKVIAIDFSFEVDNQQLLKTVWPTFYKKLAVTLPEEYIARLAELKILDFVL